MAGTLCIIYFSQKELNEIFNYQYGLVSYLMALFLIYFVGREIIDVAYIIKCGKTLSKKPKEFTGSMWVLIFYIVHVIAYSVFGFFFWNYYHTVRLTADYSVEKSSKMWFLIAMMLIINQIRKRIDKKYLTETEVNNT